MTRPFRIGDLPNVRVGVASMNDMGHVVQLHEGIANEMWTEALVGESAARHLEAMIETAEKNGTESRTLKVLARLPKARFAGLLEKLS